jgi:hypothetical protein
VAFGGLPTNWADANTNHEQEFVIPEAGTYTLIARIFDVRNAYRDTEAEVIVEGSGNQPPTDILLDNSVIAENRPAGSVVGILSAIDPDSGDTHQFELVTGDGDGDNSLFEIVGSELRAKQVFDYEVRSSYSIRVQARDSANNILAKPMTIAIGNAPEMIGGITIGDGTVQRSLVKQLSMLFDTQLQIDSGAFVVQRRDFNAADELVPVNVPVQILQEPDLAGRYRVTIRFVYTAGSTTVRNGSFALQDGNYQLLIDGNKIRSLGDNIAYDANGDGNPGGLVVFGDQPAHEFFSFFGDVRGLRVAGAFENNEFRKTINKLSTDPGFDARFDADGNGAIGAFDNNQMRQSLLKRTLNWR